ncbi:MAG: amidohydrolase family protein [Actinomycetes bacterium]
MVVAGGAASPEGVGAAPAYDLVVVNARLHGRADPCSLGVVGDRIAAVADGPLTGTTTVDARGQLVTPSFVDAHLHLCKVYTFTRFGDAALREYTTGTMGGAMTSIELASQVKDGYVEDVVYGCARRAVLEGLRHGVTHVQAFADTDTRAGLEGVTALLRVRDDLRGVVRLDVVAFPQDGLLRDPGAEDLVRSAMDLGADVVGGIPWIEYDDEAAAEHVDRMCRLAADRGTRVAMLVDDAGDPALRTTEMLARAAIRHGLEGRVVACHARAVGTYPEPSFRRLVGLARDAGLGFVTDPHTGPLHLRAFDLHDAGLPVAVGQDDIEDAYYPFGRHDMLEVAFLAGHLLGSPTLQRMDDLLGMVTTSAARVLGIEGHELAVGAPASLVVLDGATTHEVLTRHAPPRVVVSRGRVVARNDSSSWLADGLETTIGSQGDP